MTIRHRMDKLRTTLPFRVATVSIASGSDPDVIERDIEYCTEVYGDDIHDLFPKNYTPCESPLAPAGQCEFNAAALDHEICLWCGKRTG